MATADDPQWRQKMLPASFRGISFGVKASRHRVGRRQAKHEFPKRNRPYNEDMGRAPRDYHVDAFIIGDDYMTDRDALIDALEVNGPGILVHPYYGRVSVVIDEKAEIAESIDKGGAAFFSIPFIESGRDLPPAAKSDTQSKLVGACTAAAAASQSGFTSIFSMVGLPDTSAIPLLGGIAGVPGLSGLPSIPGLPSLPGLPNLPAIPNLGAIMSIGSFNGGLSGIMGAATSLVPGGSLVSTLTNAVEGNFSLGTLVSLAGGSGAATGLGLAIPGFGSLSGLASLVPGVGTLAGFVAQASGISTNLGALIQDPLTLAGTYGGLIASIIGLVSGPTDAATVLQPLFTFTSGDGTVQADITPDDFAALPAVTQQTAINVAAADAFTQQIAVVTAVQAASVGGSFTSYEEAITTRDALVAAIQAITEAPASPMAAAVNDDVYYAFTSMAAALVNDIATRATVLPRLRTVTPKQTVPALVLAWQVYQDATRDLEIVERNDVVNPNFVPGGEAVELLDG